MTTLRVWVFGCSHLTRDIKHKRESLGDAIRQSETDKFGGWDIGINLGDLSGSIDLSNTAADGKEVVRQYGALTSHLREAIYDIQGNHDREAQGQPVGWWFQRYVDPMGVNTFASGVNNAYRPYAVTGAWDHYNFKIGNINFLMMSDLSRPTVNMRGPNGGDPGGVYTQAVFDWWQGKVEEIRATDELAVTCHHYFPKNTLLATGDYEGGVFNEAGIYQPVLHGPGIDPKGSGRLHYKGDTADQNDFGAHLAAHTGDSAMWLGAHTHAAPGTQINGRKLRQQINGCQFVNCAGLTKYHGNKEHQVPRSRVFEFTSGSNVVTMQTWFHDPDFMGSIGFDGKPISLTLPKTVTL